MLMVPLYSLLANSRSALAAIPVISALTPSGTSFTRAKERDRVPPRPPLPSLKGALEDGWLMGRREIPNHQRPLAGHVLGSTSVPPWLSIRAARNRYRSFIASERPPE